MYQSEDSSFPTGVHCVSGFVSIDQGGVCTAGDGVLPHHSHQGSSFFHVMKKNSACENRCRQEYKTQVKEGRSAMKNCKKTCNTQSLGDLGSVGMVHELTKRPRWVDFL